jgi:antitoxin (DNA-binding transcriptional repressor) of toxin-antitoxin stability system
MAAVIQLRVAALMTPSVGLKVLKNKLSEYVRLTAGGETVLITDRDRVVAEISPQPGHSPLLADARLAEAVREGWLAPPPLAGSAPPPRKPVMTFRDLMQDLQRDKIGDLSR